MNPDHMIAFGFYFVLKWTLGFDQSAKDCNIGLQHVHNSRIANIIFLHLTESDPDFDILQIGIH